MTMPGGSEERYVRTLRRVNRRRRLAFGRLTPLQRSVYLLIRESPQPPTIAQVAAAVGSLASSVDRCVRFLERRGLVSVVRPDPKAGRVIGKPRLLFAVDVPHSDFAAEA